MTTIREMLPILNARRAAADMQPLKVWKASREKLQAAIDALPELKPVAAPKKQPRAKADTNDLLKITEIARDIGMNEKVARAKIRRANLSPELFIAPATMTRTAENLELILLILEGDRRTKS